MEVLAPPKTGFDKWKDGIDKAVGNAKWNTWDCEIQTAVNEYNRHLSGTAGYIPLDWQLIKAMVWVETGADDPQWRSKPMQIGVTGDPGLASFISGKEGGELILPHILKGRMTTGSVQTIPSHNLRAGIGYLLMRMANFDHRSIIVADSKVYEITVKPGDSLSHLAKAHGSTIETLKSLNPTAAVLKPGQVLKCQMASVQRVIAGWRHVSTAEIARRYNGGGDPNYAKKFDYALSLIRKGRAVTCAK